MPLLDSNDQNKVITSEIGGKAKGLFFLRNHAFHTPDFYVLPYAILKEIISDRENLEKVLNDWKQKYAISNSDLWAVRSSADNEDGTKQSFAGFFTSKINVPTTDLNEAVLEVLKSYSKLEDQEYTEQKKAQFGVIIQKMIRSEYSGVIFSHDPLNIKEKVVHINIIPGLGENLVSGKQEAFVINYANGKFEYLNKDENFYGEIFSGSLQPLERSGEEIRLHIEKHLLPLVKGTEKLSSIKHQPVDIEFTIADDTLYWLQIRPITTGNEAIHIWDNTASEANYPGLILPLSITLIKNSFYLAYKHMASFIGMPDKILKENDPLMRNMTGEINGGIYYNVTAWQTLLYQLPFGKLTGKALPKIWGMEATNFSPESRNTNFLVRSKLFLKLIIALIRIRSIRKRYIDHHSRVHARFDSIDYHAKDQAQLISIYKEMERTLTENWEAPMLNNLFSVFMMMLFKQAIKRSRLKEKYPNFMNDVLFAQGDVISVTIIREYQSLISDIRADQRMLELFNSENPVDIFQKVKRDHPIMAERINTYIANYGERSEDPELKMETVNYKEEPLGFIEHLKKNLRFAPVKNKNTAIFNYKEILKKEYPVNFIVRNGIHFIIHLTIKRVKDRENFRFMRTRTYGIVRRIFRELDARLLENKYISEKNESLCLNLDEILDPTLSTKYKSIITDRKTKYEAYRSMERATRYIQKGKSFSEVRWEENHSDEHVVNGIGCCSGTVKGTIRIIDRNYGETENLDGKILISNYFEPGQLNLFSQAAGLISVRGNLLGHTAILCREMGIPSIVGAKGLLSKVKDGDRVEMNGATGKIKLLLNDE